MSQDQNSFAVEYSNLSQQSINDTDPALRFDKGKLRWDLLPPDAMKELVAVYTFGAQKYAARNWEKGMAWSRCIASLKRHINAFELGQTVDDETGLPHMAHAAWNCIALLTYLLRNVGMNDIPAFSKETK